MARVLVHDKAMANGRLPSFEALVLEHERMVYSLAYHLTGNAASAQEVCQEVFCRLHGERGTLASPLHLTRWLRRVTCHRAIDWLRRGAKANEVPLEAAADEPAPLAPEDPLLSEHLRAWVASLPGPMRQVVVLRYQEDLGPEEIAQVLGASVNTVKSQLRRALVLLRSKAARALEAAAL